MTTEEKALALVNAVKGCEGWKDIQEYDRVPADALFAAIEAHEAYKREVSEAVKRAVDAGVDEWVYNVLARFIIPEADPLVKIAREMTLLDGVVRTDNQKAAIREGRAGLTASEDFYDRLKTATASLGYTLTKGQTDA